MDIQTVGIDLAKNVFQMPCHERARQADIAQATEARSDSGICHA
jgi:hypothetical protein